MVARLEIDVHRRSARFLTSCFQRDNFGMRLAISCVKTLSHDDTVANDNSADHRVRRCLTPTLLGQG
jgi:hypothetical protein